MNTKTENQESKDGIKNSQYISPEIRAKYLEGKKNKVIKHYFYVQKGLELVNEFKYVIAGIIAIYFALELENPLLIVLIFITAIPSLMLLGWIWVNFAVKTMEWVNIEYATYWTRYNYSLQEKQLDAINKLTKAIEEFEKKH